MVAVSAGPIEGEPAWELVGETASGAEALRWCRQLEPEVLLLELTLDEMNGPEVIAHLRRDKAPTRAVVWTGCDDDELMRCALRAHPHGFVHKQNTFAVLPLALRAVLQGGIYLCPVATRLSASVNEALPDAVLTARQRTVLQQVAEGRPTKAIAALIGVSPKTIERERTDIMAKLDAPDVAHLTRHAVKMGLVK